MARANREINVFSASAIDLFASSMGVFIVLMIIIFPSYRKKSDAPPVERQVAMVPKEELETEKKEKKALQEKREELEKKVKTLEERIVATDQSAQVKTLETALKEAEEQQRRDQEERRVLEEEKRKTEDSLKLARESQLKAVKEKEELTRELQEKSREITSLQEKLTTQPKTPTPPPPPQPTENVDKLKKELRITREELEELKKKYANNGSFAAIIAQWSSEKHDIDLVIRDSEGQTYDFKHRSVKGSMGRFALDSRTGPGAELWQSSEIKAGRYRITYQFYNNYGNTKPAKVEGTVFTRKGSLKLPIAVLEFPTKTSATYQVEIDDAGNASLVN